MRILVLRGGALGDFLVTLPALRALHALEPDVHLELIGNRRAAELGRLDGCVQTVHDQHDARWVPFFDPAPLPRDLQAWLGGFHRVISYWPDHDGALAAHLRKWGDRFVAGSAAVAAAPAARHFLQPLGSLGVSAADLAPILRLPADAHAAADQRLGGLRGFVAIHPGSGSPAKTWPPDRWHEVARRLDRPVLWITGEAEADLAPPVGAEVVRANGWPLPQLAAALARCVLYLGHDTGVTHLAAAAGVRGVALFGPTDPAVWAPPTSRLQVLRRPDRTLAAIEADEVVEASARILSDEQGRVDSGRTTADEHR